MEKETMETATKPAPAPASAEGGAAKFLQLATGFMPARALQCAVMLGLFDKLEQGGGITASEIAKNCGLVTDDPNNRSNADFLDLLVALGCLQRDGNGPTSTYSNTPEGSEFLVSTTTNSVPGFIAMAHERLYPMWGQLLPSLKSGTSPNVASGEDPFDKMVRDGTVESFAQSMAGVSNGHNTAFARKFDFSAYKTFADFGGSTGNLCTRVAQAQPHLKCTTYDRPEMEPIAKKYIQAAGVADRVTAASCNFFEAQQLPPADVIAMGFVLHDWGLPNKLMLMRKACEALPKGGAFVALDATIDDERRSAVGSLSLSLNMLLEFGKPQNSFDYSYAEFKEWAKQTGFSKTDFIPLEGLASACIAYKE